MSTQSATVITVETIVNAPVEKAWEYFTKPEHITKWNFASDDWYCPEATNDLQPGGKLFGRMEAKDGSFGFDFGGTYDQVKPNEIKLTSSLDFKNLKDKFFFSECKF